MGQVVDHQIGGEASGLTIPVTNTSTINKVCGSYRIPAGATIQVPESFLASFGYDNQLVFDFSAYSDKMRARTDDGRLSFDYWLPVSVIDGYGRHALDIYKGMLAEGVEISLHSTGWADTTFVDAEIATKILKARARMPSKIGLTMSLPYDHHIHSHQSLVKLVITQFETDHFPDYHVGNVNRCDHLIVTSSWQPEMMRRSGVRIPISVMTPGVDTEFFGYKERPRDGKFKCLMLGALTGRKFPLGAISMFWEASQGSQDWQLLLKTRVCQGYRMIEEIARRDPRITVVVGDTPPQLVPGIYQAHDCFIWPSKGEGCGLPPLEAMSTGMEVVCSRNSGMKDFIDDGWAWPIYHHGKERADLPKTGFSQEYVKAYGDVGEWWVPDIKEGAQQLRRCYEAWEAGKGKGQKAAEYVRAHHTLRQQADSVLKVVEHYS